MNWKAKVTFHFFHWNQCATQPQCCWQFLSFTYFSVVRYFNPIKHPNRIHVGFTGSCQAIVCNLQNNAHSKIYSSLREKMFKLPGTLMIHVLLLYYNQWQAQSFWTASKEWSLAKNTHMGLVYPDSPTQGGLCLLSCKIGALASRWSQSSIPDWSWLQSFLSFHCFGQLWRRICLTQEYLYKFVGTKGFGLIILPN